jgi:hypothetical protein
MHGGPPEPELSTFEKTYTTFTIYTSHLISDTYDVKVSCEPIYRVFNLHNPFSFWYLQSEDLIDEF